MATPFRDENDREWRIHLTLGKVKQINDLIGLDLLAPWDGQAIDAVTRDMFRFARIMAVAVQFDEKADPEAEGAALADGLRGAGLDRAILAFWKDLSGFFVSGQRTTFQALIAKTYEMWDALWLEGTRKVSNTSVETIKSMLNTNGEAWPAPTNPETTGNSSMKCGEPPESPLGPTPGSSTDASTPAGDAPIGNSPETSAS